MEVRKYDKKTDDNLQEKVIEKYGFLYKEQYIFSRRLLEKMFELGMTNKDLADKAGVAESSISNYANGQRIGKPRELHKISIALNVTIDYLLGLSEAITISGKEVGKMIGLKEYALNTLYELQHNTDTVNDLTENKTISNEYKSRLELFSLFMSYKPYLIDFLTYMEQYVKTKIELENKEDNSLDKKLSKQELTDKLLRN